MPGGGILTVTVPGSAWGWDEVLRRFGTMTLKDALQPAIDYAETGFPISERIARGLGPAARAAAGALRPARVLHAGRSRFGRDVVRERPAVRRQDRSIAIRDLAKTFRILQEKGRDGFYRGEIAQAIVAKSNALGGTMTLEDLAELHRRVGRGRGHQLSRLRRVHAAAAGADVGDQRDPQHPRGLRAEVGAGPDAGDARTGESEVLAPDRRSQEARVQGSVRLQRRSELRDRPDGAAAVEGACAVAVRPRRSRTAHRRPGPAAPVDASGDTIVLSTADRFGNMVSWVNSNYSLFGSGLTVPGYGFVLHNRGALFTLDPEVAERDRAAQAAVQHALGRLRDAEQPPADDGDADGRRHAGAGDRPGARQRARPRREPAGGDRHGALPPHPGAERAQPGVAPLRPGRRAAQGDGA